MLITLILICSAIALYYLFLIWNFDYWKKRGIVGPKPKPLVGNYPHTISQKRHFAYDLNDIYNKYKQDEDFVGIYQMRSPQLLILSPELARKVLVHDFKNFHDNEVSTFVDEKSDYIFANNPFFLSGEKWKEKRALLTPGLTLGRTKTVYPITLKVCQRMGDYLSKQIKMAPKDGIDARDLSLRFTSEVVSDCVLGINAESFSEKPTPILNMIKSLFDESIAVIFYILLVGLLPAIKKIYKGRFVPKDTEKYFMNLMQNAIDLRKSQKDQNERVDFLNYMLQLQEKKNLSTKQLAANTMTFLLDGFETTGIVISHCLLLLGRNQKVQDRLRSEILENLDQDGFIDFDKLSELPYLDACIHESIRIFPPGFFTNKLCTEPINFTSKSGRSVEIKKGMVTVLPLYSFMMDADFYPNPHEFKPERFLEEENGSSVKEYREKGLYYGFSDGPRVCIGMRFALIQTKAALVEIVKNFNIRVNPKTRNDDTFDPKYFLVRLDGGIWLDFEKRS